MKIISIILVSARINILHSYLAKFELTLELWTVESNGILFCWPPLAYFTVRHEFAVSYYWCRQEDLLVWLLSTCWVLKLCPLFTPSECFNIPLFIQIFASKESKEWPEQGSPGGSNMGSTVQLRKISSASKGPMQHFHRPGTSFMLGFL